LPATAPENATFALRSRTVFRDRVLPAGSVGRRSFGHSTPNGRMCSRWSHPGSEVSGPCVEQRCRYNCRQEPRHTGEDLKWPGVGRDHRQSPAEEEDPRGRGKTAGILPSLWMKLHSESPACCGATRHATPANRRNATRRATVVRSNCRATGLPVDRASSMGRVPPPPGHERAPRHRRTRSTRPAPFARRLPSGENAAAVPDRRVLAAGNRF
jgi:hypothetical protein